MAGIYSLDGDMHHSSHTMALVPLRSDGIHHAAVAHAHRASVHLGADAFSCHFLHIAHLASVLLVGESRP